MVTNVMYYDEIESFKRVYYPWDDFSFVSFLSENECLIMCDLIKEGKSLFEIKETLFNGGIKNGSLR